jgi:hypothetical protein
VGKVLLLSFALDACVGSPDPSLGRQQQAFGYGSLHVCCRSLVSSSGLRRWLKGTGLVHGAVVQLGERSGSLLT